MLTSAGGRSGCTPLPVHKYTVTVQEREAGKNVPKLGNQYQARGLHLLHAGSVPLCTAYLHLQTYPPQRSPPAL